MSKRRTFLVAYDAKDNPLTHESQQLLEEDDDWAIEHVFCGIWIVRTYLEPEFVAKKISGLLRAPPTDADLIVVPLSKERRVHSRGVWPKRVRLLRRYLADS